MDGAPTVDELSFYDQPGSDALFSTVSPDLQQHYDTSSYAGSPRRMRRSSSTSSNHSQHSTVSAISTVSAASSTSSCSSIEQVFFGPRSDKEKKLVAKLSKQTAALELCTPARDSRRTESSIRLKKKDSLEFNRRKTLGFSSRKNVEGEQSRRWEGGLLEKANLPKAGTPLRNTLSLNTPCGSPGEDHSRIPINPLTAIRSRTPDVVSSRASSTSTAPGTPEIPMIAPLTGSAPWSPHVLVDSFADMVVRDSVIVADEGTTAGILPVGSNSQRDGKTNVASRVDLESITLEAIPRSGSEENASGDSDKENTTYASSRRKTPVNVQLREPLSTRSSHGNVLQELPISGVSERKSLRDRKGDRSERASTGITPAKPLATTVDSVSARQIVCEEVTQIHAAKSESDTTDALDMTMGNSKDLIGEAQRIPEEQEVAERSLRSSSRLQSVLQEDDMNRSTLDYSPTTPSEDNEKSHSSFDPDSPLPVSRAPRHSLLLSLTASPLQLGETSFPKSSPGSPSPTRTEVLFAPEYHNVTTPTRNRKEPAAVLFNINETPSGQTISRHRDARVLRKEQATMERQATISNKLDAAVSLTMSGFKGSGYGASSIEPRRPQPISESREIKSPLAYREAEDRTLLHVTASTSTITLGPPLCSVSEAEPDIAATAQAVKRSRPISPNRPSVESHGVPSQSSVTEMGHSRIPKSIVPPSQSVLRKPMISALPVLKPSIMPTKNNTTHATQKSASTITMSYKAVRPEATSQPELARFATPVKGRLPNTFAFRSPATSRVVSATNPAKPIHVRSVSGNMASSVSGAVRPMTPGTSRHRSLTASESTSMTPRRDVFNGNMGLTQSTTTPSVARITASQPTVTLMLQPPVLRPVHADTESHDTILRLQPALNVSESSSSNASDTTIMPDTTIRPKSVETKSAPSVDRLPESGKPATLDIASSVTQGQHGASNAVQPRRTVAGRPTRAVRPMASVPLDKTKRQVTRTAPEPKRLNITAVTDKELGTITKLNTARNEVYFCTLDRNVVKKEGPRPPSPSKVRTIAEREEEEKKLGRGARAKRRGKGRSTGDFSSDQEETDEPLSLADLLPPLKHVRGAGDDEDYQTPARPLKRGRKSGVAGVAGDDPSPTAGPRRKKSRRVTLVQAGDSVGEDKFVKWDKGLVVIDRPEPSVPMHHREGEEIGQSLKSCLKQKTQLDHLGNLPNATAPIPKLKRNRIPVFCFWYDGEEPPVAAPATVVVATSSAASRRGKK